MTNANRKLMVEQLTIYVELSRLIREVGDLNIGHGVSDRAMGHVTREELDWINREDKRLLGGVDECLRIFNRRHRQDAVAKVQDVAVATAFLQ